MHPNLLLAWLTTFFLLHYKRRPIKPIANYDASIILIMHFKNSVRTYLTFYAGVLHSLAAISFLLGLTVISHFKSFSNLHFLGLTFFLHQRCFWGRSNFTYRHHQYLNVIQLVTNVIQLASSVSVEGSEVNSYWSCTRPLEKAVWLRETIHQ